MTTTRKRARSGSNTAGIILIVIGTMFLLDQLGIMDFGRTISTFWPVILIIIGLRIILFPKEKSESEMTGAAAYVHVETESDTGQPLREGELNESKVFGDIRLILRDNAFSGGRCSLTFGDIDIDMASIQLAEGQRTLYINAVFGDIRLILPNDIPVLVRANTTAGDIDILGERGEGLFVQRSLKTEDFDTAETRLIVVASLIFGDIRIWKHAS